MAQDIRHALCYHRPGSGRAVLPLAGVLTVHRSYLSLVLPELVHEPPIGATMSTTNHVQAQGGPLTSNEAPPQTKPIHMPRRSEAEPR
jgi:hypothetical protein